MRSENSIFGRPAKSTTAPKQNIASPYLDRFYKVDTALAIMAPAVNDNERNGPGKAQQQQQKQSEQQTTNCQRVGSMNWLFTDKEIWNRVIGKAIASTDDGDSPQLAVFGYGSLIWNPSFEFERRDVGYVAGYVRRFWQGNVTHRGKPGSPGRVATLIEEENGETWGVAYHLKGEGQIKRAIRHLFTREIALGGYAIELLDFRSQGEPSSGEATKVITFVATPDNRHYLGPAPLESEARTIGTARGASGHNLEYVFKLVDALRNEAPHGVDSYLGSLEAACHRYLGCVLAQRHHALCCRRHAFASNCCACLESAPGDDDSYVVYCLESRLCKIREHLDDFKAAATSAPQ